MAGCQSGSSVFSHAVPGGDIVFMAWDVRYGVVRARSVYGQGERNSILLSELRV